MANPFFPRRKFPGVSPSVAGKTIRAFEPGSHSQSAFRAVRAVSSVGHGALNKTFGCSGERRIAGREMGAGSGAEARKSGVFARECWGQFAEDVGDEWSQFGPMAENWVIRVLGLASGLRVKRLNY